MQKMNSLADLPTGALTARLYEIRKAERGLLVEFLTYLGELDRRRTYLELGFPSLFAFLTDHLGYTRSAAFRRSTAARLVVRFPVLCDPLADGRLCLTTLVELRDVLDAERLDEIVARAAGRTEDEVRQLVAALQPRPEPMDLLRRLPPSSPRQAPEPAPVPAPALPPAAAPRPARVEPISEERHVLRVTVGREFVADLAAVRAALSQVVPDGNLERILHECLRRTLVQITRRQRGGERAGAGGKRPPKGRTIPAAVRRAVWKRDEGRCAFVGSDGHRCGSTHQLEYHHVRAFAAGGDASESNIQLCCSSHNGFIAERELGAEHVRLARGRARAARGAPTAWGADNSRPAPASPP